MKQKTFQPAFTFMLAIYLFLTACDTDGGYQKQLDDPKEQKLILAHEKLLSEKLSFYNKAFPHISFVVMQNGKDWGDNIINLSILLGHAPENLDYEHPEDLREDLMYVSIERLIIMMKNGIPSASLFKGDPPKGWKQQICVLTISPRLIAADDETATRNLLTVSDEEFARIPRERYIKKEIYLEYVFDHEAYHCLKSMYLGGQPMSYKRYWSSYSSYRNEQGADAFALAMLVKRQKGISPQINNLVRIRNLSILNADPEHWTYAAISTVLGMSAEEIITMDIYQIFELANRIRAGCYPEYQEFLHYQAATIAVMDIMGLDEYISKENWQCLEETGVNDILVQQLLDRASNAYTALFSQKSPWKH